MNHLQLASKRDVKYVLDVCKQNKDLKSVYRHHKKGYTNDKGKTMRHLCSIPANIFFHPEFKKYFNPDFDVHELSKHIEMFRKKFPEFDLSTL